MSILEINIGYMELVNSEAIFGEVGIDEKNIFYGMEEIIPTRFVWRIFSIIKKLAPSIVQFYKLPPEKIHGVVIRVEMLSPPQHKDLSLRIEILCQILQRFFRGHDTFFHIFSEIIHHQEEDADTDDKDRPEKQILAPLEYRE